jgi:hypothetical protein
VGSAYNWAVYMRGSPLVHLVKLPWQVNHWDNYADEPGKKADDLDVLDELDVWIAHLPILRNHPDLFEWVNRHYQVAAAFYDQATYEELARRTAGAGACRRARGSCATSRWRTARRGASASSCSAAATRSCRPRSWAGSATTGRPTRASRATTAWSTA